MYNTQNNKINHDSESCQVSVKNCYSEKEILLAKSSFFLLSTHTAKKQFYKEEKIFISITIYISSAYILQYAL